MAWEDRGRGRTSAYGEGRGEGEWEGKWGKMGANGGAVIQRHTERMREKGAFERAHFSFHATGNAAEGC